MSTHADWLRARLQGEGPPLLLDGATGADLFARGVRTPPPLWSAWALLTHQPTVKQIAKDHVAAGADVVTANTFRTHARNLAMAGEKTRAEELTERAVRLAREGADAARGDRPVAVVGSLAPLEDCYRPDLVPDDEALHEEHARQAAALAVAGCDGILVETMNTIRESVAATRAAVASGLPVISCVVCKPGAVLWSGESVADWVAAVQPLAPDALGINCTRLPALDEALAALAAAAPDVPRAAYGNIGEEDPVLGWDSSDCPPATYAQAAKRWLDAGARLIGGCCGTLPEHITACRTLLDA